MTPRHYDVVMATDFRFPGGTTASVVEELRAQDRSGYSTGLLHLPSPVQRSHRPFAPRVRNALTDGLAELIAGPQPVVTPLLLIRHPSVLSSVPDWLPPIDAQHVIIVVNQVPRDDRGTEPYYDVAAVHDNARRAFGKEPVWAPIGPGVREAIARDGPVPMTAANWENIIDTEPYAGRRTGFVGDRAVIGRHSRGHWSKWPGTKADMLAAYPGDPAYQVRVMGGTEAPEQILGSLPANWESLPFDSLPIPEFLRGIDFFVYVHHPGLVEAFGRVVLEGLASGAVCFAPPALKPIFGDVVTYGEASDVRAFVDRYYADPNSYLERSAQGRALVEERFSYQAHIDRLTALIGPPATNAPPTDPATGGTPEATAHDADTVESPKNTEPVTIIHAVGAEPEQVHSVLRGWQDASWPVVVMGEGSAFNAPNASVETLPVSGSDHQVDAGPAANAHVRMLMAAYQTDRVLLLGHAAIKGSVRGNGVRALRPGVSSDAGALAGPAPDWSVTRPPVRKPGTRRRLSDAAAHVARRQVGMARAHAPRWVRRMGRQGVNVAEGARRRASAALRSSNTPLAVPTIYSHLPAGLPVVLVVVASENVDPSTTLPALLGRSQESSAFKVAIIAPRSWGSLASDAGVTFVPWISEEEWPAQRRHQRPRYVRELIEHIGDQVHATAVVNLDASIDSVREPRSAMPLDVIEGAARSAAKRV